MALLWLDGFDGIEDWANETDAGAYYDVWGPPANLPVGANINISATHGRRVGSLGVSCTSTDTAQEVGKNIVPSSTVTSGIALLRNTTYVETNLNYRRLMHFSPAVFLSLESGGSQKIVVRSGSDTGTILGTVPDPVPLSSWIYLEVKGVVSATVGSVEIRFDGVTVLNLTGLNLGTTAVSKVSFFTQPNNSGFGSGTQWDDFYICNDVATDACVSFLGDLRIDSAPPVSDGTHQDWIRSTGTNTWSLVDENPPSATDFVSGTTVGHKVTTKVNFADTGRQIVGVMVSNIANESEGSGTRKVKPIAKLGETTLQGTEQTLLTTYLRCPQVLQKAPDGTEWSYQKINDSEFGLEVTA